MTDTGKVRGWQGYLAKTGVISPRVSAPPAPAVRPINFRREKFVVLIEYDLVGLTVLLRGDREHVSNTWPCCGTAYVL